MRNTNEFSNTYKVRPFVVVGIVDTGGDVTVVSLFNGGSTTVFVFVVVGVVAAAVTETVCDFVVVVG